MLALQAQVDQSRTESIDILFQLSIGNRNEFAARNIFLEISGMIPVKFRGTVDQILHVRHGSHRIICVFIFFIAGHISTSLFSFYFTIYNCREKAAEKKLSVRNDFRHLQLKSASHSRIYRTERGIHCPRSLATKDFIIIGLKWQ